MKEGELGTGWSFPPRFGLRGLEVVCDAQDIRESLQVLFATRKGERFLRPGYGSDLHKEVFEILDISGCDRIAHLVREAIRVHERRVDVVEVQVEPDKDDPACVHVRISYRIVSLGEMVQEELILTPQGGTIA